MEIPAERQAYAQQVSNVFASLHTFLQSLAWTNDKGELQMTEQLRNALTRISEASHWATSHALSYGQPPQADASPASTDAANTGAAQ